jgi:DnaJ-domain-containing protein 1
VKVCPRCQATLETPLACSACGALGTLVPARERDPFLVLGIARAYAVDPAELKRRLLSFSRLVHPDFFATEGEEARGAAEAASAALNAAHEILSSDFLRADWLVRSQGGPDESHVREMPQAFLLEVLEWNETLEAARQAAPGSPERAAAVSLRGELLERRKQLFATLARRMTPLPQPGSPELLAARKDLNAARYLDKTLSELDALRVAQSLSH